MGAPNSEFVSTPSSDNHANTHWDTDESEWEYEYDSNETEDFYLTLDLSTHRLHAPPNKRLRRRTYSQLSARAKALHKLDKSAVGRARDGENTGAPVENEQAEERPTSAQSEEPATPQTPPDGQQNAKNLQILGLHTQNPFLKLDDTFYSCYWTTDLGTQLHLAHPGDTTQPLRPGRKVDVVALSRVRLIAQPVSLRKRKAPPPGTSSKDAIVVEDDEDVDIVADTDENFLSRLPDNRDAVERRFADARKKSSDPLVKAQATFLERLADIKKQKGETDNVPLHSVKIYDPPANADDIRERYLAAEAERLERDPKRGQEETADSSSTTLAHDPAAALLGHTPPRRRRGPKPRASIEAELGLQDQRQWKVVTAGAEKTPEGHFKDLQ